MDGAVVNRKGQQTDRQQQPPGAVRHAMQAIGKINAQIQLKILEEPAENRGRIAQNAYQQQKGRQPEVPLALNGNIPLAPKQLSHQQHQAKHQEIQHQGELGPGLQIAAAEIQLIPGDDGGNHPHQIACAHQAYHARQTRDPYERPPPPDPQQEEHREPQPRGAVKQTGQQDQQQRPHVMPLVQRLIGQQQHGNGYGLADAGNVEIENLQGEKQIQAEARRLGIPGKEPAGYRKGEQRRDHKQDLRIPGQATEKKSQSGEQRLKAGVPDGMPKVFLGGYHLKELPIILCVVSA